jgi:hypothetical protein
MEMKKIKSALLFLMVTLTTLKVSGQPNAFINVLTLNSGQVGLGGTVDIQVEVGNSGTANIIASKVKTAITVPTALVSVLPNAQQTGLPAGWTILSNTAAGVITLCNGTDVITPGVSRIFVITIQGNTLGGPSTIVGQLTFSGGVNCGSPGSLAGDSPADNNSTTSIQVIVTTPLTLIDFNAVLKDCQPSLNWITESETNTDRFEVERSNANSNDWQKIAAVTASGFNPSKSYYTYKDVNVTTTTDKVWYRLKMIDKDGSFKYSKILPVLLNCKTAKLLTYPSPVQDGKLNVSLTGTVGYTEATIFNTAGQVLLKKQLNNGITTLNVARVAEGTYILNIKDANGFNKNIKVTISH